MSISGEILEFKKQRYGNKDVPLLDVIQDYAFEKDMELEEIGKLLSEDEMFLELLEKNLRRFGYIRDNLNKKQIW